jgi:phytoene dehydrogenase-like protein
MPRYDAIVIGGGHNGLVTTAYLARAGRSVLVLERRELIGGCSVTEEVWPGYRVFTAAYPTSLLQERIIRDLKLARCGYKVDAKDPAFSSAFPDGPRHGCETAYRRVRWARGNVFQTRASAEAADSTLKRAPRGSEPIPSVPADCSATSFSSRSHGPSS